MVKVVFNKKKKNVFLLQKILISTSRKNLLKTHIWSIMLRGCETWTITKEEKKTIDIRSVMQKISWTDRNTNEYVLERVSEERILCGKV